MSAPAQSIEEEQTELRLSWARRWRLLTLGVAKALHMTPSY